MPNLSKKGIKILIGNGDTENALELILTALSEGNKNYNRFTLLKGQWATAQEQIRLLPRPVNIMSKISTFAIKSYSYDKLSSPVERPYAPDT